ncbi:MAG: hypothetical protein M0R17_05250 [Candidatus Omnitrophica bacterium]|nr:hypothetical protein [Candidatus Omnitrophota bacterium]
MRLISTDERYINNSWEQIPKEWSNTTYYHNVFGNIRRKITINTNKGFYQEKNKITMSISIQL